VKIRLRIPLGDSPDGDHPRRGRPHLGQPPASSGTAPVSTQDRLRSLHACLVSMLDAARDAAPDLPPGEFEIECSDLLWSAWPCR
jgi:hypothetical protein